MHFLKGASILGFHNFEQKVENVIELEAKFISHLEAEGISYGTRDEFEYRFELFKQKDAVINEWNEKQDSFQLGHNMFSTMTDAERNKWLGLGTVPEELMEPTIFDESDNGITVDWRSKGGVNAVKNQASCGSCWAFAGTAGTEFAHWKATGKLLNLSEQQLVDCDPRSHGCSGGWYFWAWDYLK